MPAPAASKQAKSKKSKLVKLSLAPELLSRFANEGSRKRKLQVDDSERPNKRQSLEPNGVVNGKRQLVSVEKHGGDRPRLIVKMRLGKGKLPVE
jgi:transcription initiation factor TFIID subunit 2